MDTMSNTKIIDKIRKLLTLSNSSNEHEASLAAARAAELMLIHEIESAQLDCEDVDDIDQEIIGETGSIVHWKGSLASGLAESMGCQFVYGCKRVNGKRTRTYLVMGQESKRSIIKYMYAYLCADLMRLANDAFDKAVIQHIKEGFRTKLSARSWKNGFRLGAATIIRKRLIAQRSETHKEAEAAGNSDGVMVVVNNAKAVDLWVSKNMGPFQSGSAATTSSPSGYGAGKTAGQTVSIGNRGKSLGNSQLLGS